MKLTQSQFNTTVEMLRGFAKEPVRVAFFTSAYWAFGSELATLRLLAKYRDCKQVRHGFSENLSSFYFVMETPNFCGEFETE